MDEIIASNIEVLYFRYGGERVGKCLQVLLWAIVVVVVVAGLIVCVCVV